MPKTGTLTRQQLIDAVEAGITAAPNIPDSAVERLRRVAKCATKVGTNFADPPLSEEFIGQLIIDYTDTSGRCGCPLSQAGFVYCGVDPGQLPWGWVRFYGAFDTAVSRNFPLGEAPQINELHIIDE